MKRCLANAEKPKKQIPISSYQFKRDAHAIILELDQRGVYQGCGKGDERRNRGIRFYGNLQNMIAVSVHQQLLAAPLRTKCSE